MTALQGHMDAQSPRPAQTSNGSGRAASGSGAGLYGPVSWEEETPMVDQSRHHASVPVVSSLSRRDALRRFAAAATAGPLLARGGLKVRAQGTPAATPRGDARPGTVIEEVTFDLSGGVTTHGQFDYPSRGEPPFPAVLMLQGSGPVDRHETFVLPDGTSQRPFDLIAGELTNRGLAVFRFDKRGVCPPSQPCDPVAYGEQTKPVLTADALLAYARMIANPLIDADRTAVLGHSEGTWLAPALPVEFPNIRALVLIGTGLGPMHVLSFTQVALPLLGLASFDTNGDGAIAEDELPTAPADVARFQARMRVQGQIFLLRYEGSGAELRPAGLNLRLDSNGDGKLDLLTEVRPVYEAFFANLQTPLAVLEPFADPAVLPVVAPLVEQLEAFEGDLYASYWAEPMDVNRRTLLAGLGGQQILIVNGEHDDQTPAASARLLGESLRAAGFPVTISIYPGLSHVLSPQADIFAPYDAGMQPEPIDDIGWWLEEALA
jgi:dienelactone hydrolase